jgi:integrase
VVEWKGLLADWPVKAAEAAAFKGMSIREIVAANKRAEHPKPTITRATQRRYLGSLSSFCEWLRPNGHLAINPVRGGVIPKKAAPTNKRKSLTDDQLRALFGSPLFRTCRGEGWRDLDIEGNVAVRDHRYWIPLIMAYSGARPAEIAQLHVADVRQLHGTWIMHVTTEGEGNKRTKTKSSMRVVPVHSRLIDRGFLEHVKAMKAAGEKQVFPEVIIPKEGQIAATFSREFNRYLQRIGVKQGKDLVVYSLRHRCRAAGILDAEIGLIVGHDKASMTGKYGVEQEGTINRRTEIVEAVQYDI